MSNVINFPNRFNSDFNTNKVSDDLIEFANNIKYDQCDPPLNSVITIIKQGDEYVIGGWGKIHQKDRSVVLSELRCFFNDLFREATQ